MKERPRQHRRGRWRWAALPLSATILLCALGATAWVGEDALITFRTVDNLVNGYGPRWNVEERVQTFTHPLWMLVLAAVYFFTREIYFTVTAVCLLCSVGGFVIAARFFRDRPAVVVGALLAPFLLSRSLISFSTSGFENPLTLLLLSVLAVLLFGVCRGGEVPWLRIFLVAALMGVNRPDTLLLPLPALLALVLIARPRVPWGRIALGFLPLAAWLLFSLLYYGSPFPNTAPAKLSSGLPLGWYLGRGLVYLLGLVRMDLAGGLWLALGLAIGGRAAIRWCTGRAGARERATAALGAGLLLYCVYVVFIGGDFLVGRFWSAPIWLSILLIAFHMTEFLDALKRATWSGRAVAALVAVGLLLLTHGIALRLTLHLFGTPRPAGFRSNAHVRLNADLDWEISAPGERFRAMGRVARESGRKVVRIDPIGFAGIEAGRSVTIVDPYGLADPLIARLRPVEEASEIGHLYREIPPGYLEAKESGSLAGLDPDLREYVSVLRRITRGPLWSAGRLGTILRYQLGQYEPLLRRYESRREGDGTSSRTNGPRHPARDGGTL